MIRSWPSTSPASLASARAWTRDLALATTPAASFASFLPRRFSRTSAWIQDIQIVGGEVRVPGLEGAHLRRPAHRVAVLVDACDDDVTPVGRREAEVAAGDLETRRQALHVPLPRAGERLVEVVDVEQHLPLG